MSCLAAALHRRAIALARAGSGRAASYPGVEERNTVRVAVQFVIAFFALFGIWFVWNVLRLPGSFEWNAARRARRERQRLAALPTLELVDEVRRLIHFQRWGRFHSANKILNDGEWTDAALLETLLHLRAEAANEQPGHYGRGSSVFEFSDCGLMSIVEILKTRTGAC